MCQGNREGDAPATEEPRRQLRLTATLLRTRLELLNIGNMENFHSFVRIHSCTADGAAPCSILQTIFPSPSHRTPSASSSISTVWLSSPLRFLVPDFHAIFHLEPQFRNDDGPQVTSELTAPAQIHEVVGQASPALFVLPPSSFSRKLVKQWIGRVTSFSWESPALLLMRKHLNHAIDLAWEEMEGRKVRVGVLPRKAFPNGLQVWQTMERKHLRRAVMVADEYHLSSTEKVKGLKEFGLWLTKSQ